jgi:exopolyphosphatase/guanosine-5'-triphosphate,3'-diphosphate pyrophosphatase
VCSFDVGSLRLTCRHLDGDPPSRGDVKRAREQVRMTLADEDYPMVAVALATGGTARAVRKLVGRSLGAAELAEALDQTTGTTAAKLAKRTGIDPDRARTLTAGVLILTEVQQNLGVPLEVARGGLREGLAEEMLARSLSSAA